MFSNWFSGDARERYCASSHKQRMDQVGNSLVELHYADEVLRQHLHEWLRFSGYLDERGLLLAAVNADTTRPYLAERKPFPRSSYLGQNLPRNRRTGPVPPPHGLTTGYSGLVRPDSGAVSGVCERASRTSAQDHKEVHPEAVNLRAVSGGDRSAGPWRPYAPAHS